MARFSCDIPFSRLSLSLSLSTFQSTIARIIVPLEDTNRQTLLELRARAALSLRSHTRVRVSREKEDPPAGDIAVR